MTLNQLRYFQQLARTEHFHQAAASLYVSYPSLSRAIAQLEQELGVSLFEKRGRNARLTPAGRVFLKYVERALDQLDQGVARTSALAPIQSSVSIGCILPAVSTYLAPLLQEFQHSTGICFPCRTWTGHSQALLEGMLDGTYDIVFCTHLPQAKGIRFTPVCAFPYYAVMRLDDPLAGRPYVLPQDLKGRTMLFTEIKPYCDMIRGVLDHFQIEPVVGGLSNDETVLLGMVQAGLGIFLSTDYPQIHSEDIVLVPLKQDELRRYVYLATCEGRDYPARVQSLIQFARRRAQGLPAQSGPGPILSGPKAEGGENPCEKLCI